MMNYRIKKFSMAGIAAVILALAGCLVSGTFVLSILLVENEGLTYFNDMYFGAADLTKESVWEDHSDNIKNIDVVGFELWVTNNTTSANKFDVYVAPWSSTLDSTSDADTVKAKATQVLAALPLAADGTTHISYGQSFKYLMNVDVLKKLVESGKFKAWAIKGTPGVDVTVDKLRVIVTLTAGA